MKPHLTEDDLEPKFKSPGEILAQAEIQKETFAELLSTLDIDSKLKSLWREIYENAVEDRMRAFLAWTDLYTKMHGSSDEHFKNGQTLSKYMERMEKANAQLLKLAELVDNANLLEPEEDEAIPSAEDFYKKNEKRFQ